MVEFILPYFLSFQFFPLGMKFLLSDFILRRSDLILFYPQFNLQIIYFGGKLFYFLSLLIVL